MAPRLPTVRLSTLVVEELRSLLRNVFALAAVAVVLALLALAGAFALGGAGAIDGFLLLMWVVAPLGVSIVLATRVASARRSRFVDSLYTTPLRQPTWLAAQAIVGAVMAAFVLLVTAPFVLVYAAHLGAPPNALGLLLTGVAVGAFAVAFGLFCGVIVGDAGGGAAAGLAGGGAALSFVAFVVQGVLNTGSPEPLALQVIRVMHLSPITLAVEGSGLTLFGVIPSSPTPAALGLIALALGMLAAAWLAFTRHQGPLGWEPRAGSWLVPLLVVASIALPIATANVDYHAIPDDRSIRFNPGDHTKIGFVAQGAPIDNVSFSPFTTLRNRPLWFGQDNAFDMLVMLDVPANASIRDVHVATAGGASFIVDGGTLDMVGAALPEGTATAPAFFDEARDATPSPVFRVPVVFHPVKANAILYAHANIAINTTFVADGQPYASNGSIPLTTHVPHASAQLLAAGAPLPLAFATGAIARKLKTR